LAKDHIPPQAIESEQVILGAIIQNNEGLHRAMSRLSRDDFYLSKHRAIFGAICKLYRKNSKVDLVMLGQELSDRDQLDEIGGRRYLMDLTDSVVTFSNIEEHCDLIIEAATKNRLINYFSDSIENLYEPTIPASNIISQTTGTLMGLSGATRKIEITNPYEDAEDFMESIGTGGVGLQTGFRRLDYLTLGLQKAYFIVIAARPSVGKTSLALNICRKIAIEDKKPVLFISLEMSKYMLRNRLAASAKGISTYRIRTGKLDDRDHVKLSDFAGDYSNSKLHIVDPPTVDIQKVDTLIHQARLQHAVELVIIDHMDLISGPENDFERTNINSEGIRQMVKKYDIPIIALYQLSRAGAEGVPKLSHLRGSGKIEENAHQVIFIHRERDENNLLADEGKFIFAKGRDEQTGMVDVRFDKQRSTFYEIAKEVDDVGQHEQSDGQSDNPDYEPPVF
jgi:replicative DNA helicase